MADAAAVKLASPAKAEGSGSTYAQILRSTAMIGGSSLVNIAFAVIRNKAIAVLLGPSGIGLMGLYTAISDLAQSLASLGIQAAGVRQIAEAAGSEDGERIARTATVLRRVAIVLGIAGAALLVALSLPISILTFGDGTHAAAVALLALAVFFRLVSSGQLALLQGLRHIGDLARINMLAAFFSTVISIPLIYLFGEQGIVPSLVAVAAISVGTSWWYSSKIRIERIRIPAREVRREASELLKLGVVFMASGFLTLGAAYAVRLIVLRFDGLEAAGFYQAAWALGGLYAGFILQAMGTDFYPRLTAVAQDNVRCNALVNEQAHVSILLAGPGLLATLTIAPLLMTLFYSAEFDRAADLLRWLCLGMLLRIVAWPMGFIILAKGARQIFFWTEVAATAVHVGLAWLLVSWIGPAGAGAAFFGLYVWHAALVWWLVRRMTGFRWTKENLLLGLLHLAAGTLVFAGFHLVPFWQATAFGAALTAASGLYGLKALLPMLPSILTRGAAEGR